MVLDSLILQPAASIRNQNSIEWIATLPLTLIALIVLYHIYIFICVIYWYGNVSLNYGRIRCGCRRKDQYKILEMSYIAYLSYALPLFSFLELKNSRHRIGLRLQGDFIMYYPGCTTPYYSAPASYYTGMLMTHCSAAILFRVNEI